LKWIELKKRKEYSSDRGKKIFFEIKKNENTNYIRKNAEMRSK
jgi:hypothetical protein